MASGKGEGAGSLYLDVRFSLSFHPVPSLQPFYTNKELELQGGL